jgi:hypothetical protein
MIKSVIESSQINMKLDLETRRKMADMINANSQAIFPGDEKNLGLTFLNPIDNKISTTDDSKFLKINGLRAKSKLINGIVGIDSSIYYNFSRGAEIELVLDPEFEILCLGHRDRSRVGFPGTHWYPLVPTPKKS